MSKARQRLEAMYGDKPMLVFGHRGASAAAPMNTLPAFELAAAQGADGIELDVHRSADGEAVIVHDFTVDKTTDGSGSVQAMTLAQLKALDAGSWKDESFAGTRIPTLDEVFEAVGQRLYINVEIKSKFLQSDGLEQLVANKIQQFDMQDRVLVSSFNPLALRRFRRIMPDVPVGYLTAPDDPFYKHWLMLGLAYEAVHPYHDAINPALVQNVTQQGHIVNTWTVNDSERAVALRDMGVRCLITDNPDVIINALAD